MCLSGVVCLYALAARRSQTTAVGVVGLLLLGSRHRAGRGACWAVTTGSSGHRSWAVGGHVLLSTVAASGLLREEVSRRRPPTGDALPRLFP